MNDKLKLLHPTIDVVGERETEQRLVIRGVIDPSTIQAIRVDNYQRQVLGGGKSSALKAAAKTSTLPDVELGMRGDGYQTRGEGDQQCFVLTDPVYVIDGLQRVAAVKAALEEGAVSPKIGAVVHVDTTVEWEIERFKILNQERTRLSPGVLLRNERSRNSAIDALFRLTTEDADFVLYRRVCWEQRMRRDELLQALKFCRVISVLHSRFAAGMSEDVRHLGANLSRQRDTVGPSVFMNNVKMFYGIVQDLWGIKDITYREQALQLKGGFLNALALLFSQMDEFWVRDRLSLDKRQRKKLSKFPLKDSSVAGLCGGGGASVSVLLEVMKHHLNSGRRTNRIVPNGESECPGD